MMEMVLQVVDPKGAMSAMSAVGAVGAGGAVGAVEEAGAVARPSALSHLRGDVACEPKRANTRDATALEALHLDAADALLRRHGRSLADCQVSRECPGLDAEDDGALYVVRVGAGIDTYVLNEALTALQLARGLTPSAQLDVVFQP